MHLSTPLVFLVLSASQLLALTWARAVVLHRPRDVYAGLTSAERDEVVRRRRMRTAKLAASVGSLSCAIYAAPPSASATTTFDTASVLVTPTPEADDATASDTTFEATPTASVNATKIESRPSVDVRACPSQKCALVQTVMGGDFVSFSCWTRGKADDQDLFWEKTVNGTYISEAYITGSCPYSLPPCFD